MKNGESDRFKGRGAEDERGIAKTCGRRDAREEGARFVNETFDDALARIGLLPAPPVTGEAGGVLYRGDGVRSTGWYWAWSLGREAVVASCDFTLLCSCEFSFDFHRYFAVRRERAGLLPPCEARAFLETRSRPAALLLPRGIRFAYTEVEYADEYCRANLGGGLTEVLGPVAAVLQATGERGAWRPEVVSLLKALEETARTHAGQTSRSGLSRASCASDELILQGSVDALMGQVLRMEGDRIGSVGRDDAFGIAAVVEHIRAHLDEPLRQEDFLALSRMGKTKFKSVFKAVMGKTAAGFVAETRIEHACQLLLDGSMAVTDVARACGYESPTSFSAAFRRRTGLSPRAWRRRARIAFSGDPQAFVRLAQGIKGMEREGGR